MKQRTCLYLVSFGFLLVSCPAIAAKKKFEPAMVTIKARSRCGESRNGRVRRR